MASSVYQAAKNEGIKEKREKRQVNKQQYQQENKYKNVDFCKCEQQNKRKHIYKQHISAC